jgi:hypothetical protein
VTPFHHQPEAQHPKSSAIHKPPADYPIFGGKGTLAETSAAMREILDSMWLFNDIFEQALAKFGEIKAQQKG